MIFFVYLLRFVCDGLALIVLYDYFSQPFRFYGLDPLTRMVYVISRRVCDPLQPVARRLLPMRDRDPAPVFACLLLLVLRGIFYGILSGVTTLSVTALLLGISLSLVDFLTRIILPLLLFLIYLDIQLAPHLNSLMGNVPVMMIHEMVKYCLILVRKLLPSFRPVAVFVMMLLYLAIVRWGLLLLGFLPFLQIDLLSRFPVVLIPREIIFLGQPIMLLMACLLQMVAAFLWGIFILLLLQMISGFSGMSPWNQTYAILKISVTPWVRIANRLFPFAQWRNIDFSVGILLFLMWALLELLTNSLFLMW